VSDFVMVASHIKPTDAAQEMDNLTLVHDAVKAHWNMDVSFRFSTTVEIVNVLTISALEKRYCLISAFRTVSSCP